jgi:hypothetical protein
MNKAYAKSGHDEAVPRMFCLTTLQRSAGRTTEIAFCTWDGIEWDVFYRCAFVDILQVRRCRLTLSNPR